MYFWAYCSIVLVCALSGETQSSVILQSGNVVQLHGSVKLINEVIGNYFPKYGRLGLVLSRSVEIENIFIRTPEVAAVLYTIYHDGTVECHSKNIDLGGYIFMTSCNSSLESQTIPALKCFNRTSFRFRSHRILIVDVCLERYSYDSERYLSYLEYIWKTHGLVYVSILPLCKTLKENANILRKIFTYNPFQPVDSFHSSLVKANIDTDFVHKFQQRFRNMNGYKIEVLDILSTSLPDELRYELKTNLKKEFRSYFNVTMNIHEDHDFDKYDLHMGLSEDVFNKHENPVLTMFPTFDYLKLQYLSRKYEEASLVVVKSPPIINTWNSILYAFTKELWFWIGFSYICVCFCAIIFSKCRASKDSSSTMLDLSRVCNALMSIPITKLPTRNSERLLWALSVWLGFMVTTCLLGQIIRFMFSKPLPPLIDTFEDLNKSGIKIENIFVADILKLNSTEFDDRVGNTIDLETMCSDGKIKAAWLIESQVKTSDLSSIKGMHIMREKGPVLYYRVSVPAGSIFFEHFDMLFSRLYQTNIGLNRLYEAWRKMQLLVLSEEFPFFEDCYTKIDSAAGLTYGDLKVAFYSLYVGLTLSAVCFVIEITMEKLKTITAFSSRVHKMKKNREITVV